MRALVLVLLLTSCYRYTDVHCYVVDYIEVNGRYVKVNEQRCGCFPTSSPDIDREYRYEGSVYNAKRILECDEE